MCRIAGIYNPNSISLEQDVLVMRDAMHRGGPDGSGIYIDKDLGLALGHRRLALLDLTEAGHQPMQSADGGIQIIFNGEIYNFQDIKKDLEENGFDFFTQTDTEVIINAYIQWGTKCFELFKGMFALAIWDKPKQQLILARDHAGIKPLYYHISDKEIIFASEIRAFKALYPDWPENADWKIPFLAYGHLPEPFTTLQGVKPLQKGCFSVIQLPSLTFSITPYYTYTYVNKVTDRNEALKLLRENIDQSVLKHLISDAPLGVFLSGGIDSSILTILASKYSNKTLKTLSIIFEEQDFSEEVFQKIIVNQTMVEHHSFLVTNEMFHNEFSQIMEAMDQPSIDGINTYFICKFAKAYGLTAVLSGLGADELLGGYESIKRSNLLRRLLILPSIVLGLSNKIPREKIKRIAYLQTKTLQNKYLFYRGIYNPYQIAEILDLPIKQVISVLNNVTIAPINTNDEAQIAAHLEEHLYMQNQLLKDTDYMSMWHGIEVRVPFLGKDLISACNSIDPKLKFNLKGRPKQLLIDAFKDVLPEAIWNRKKQGFTFPFVKWMYLIVPKSRGLFFDLKYKQLIHSHIHWSKYWTYLLATTLLSKIIFLKNNYAQVCFYNLDAFATMGGIEKFNRAFLYGLSGLENEACILADAASMYDSYAEGEYFESSNYRVYKKKKLLFVWKELINSSKYQTIVLGHVNLALFGLLIKRFRPSTKIFLVAHGIEVWNKLDGFKKAILANCDVILAVSNFTKQQLIKSNGISPDKIAVFHNTIDPFFHFPTKFDKPTQLLERYNISKEEKVILTLTRLAYTEKYKGYDKVIDALPAIIKKYPKVKYLIAGKADEREKTRLKLLIETNKLENNVFLIGFVAEEEITDHYKLADLFIMPSRKEGFGIVFIEAMACGLPVIAGNKDGSVDALKNGELGMLINPEDKQEMIDKLEIILSNDSYTLPEKKLLQQKVNDHFGFPRFYQNLKSQVLN